MHFDDVELVSFETTLNDFVISRVGTFLCLTVVVCLFWLIMAKPWKEENKTKAWLDYWKIVGISLVVLAVVLFGSICVQAVRSMFGMPVIDTMPD